MVSEDLGEEVFRLGVACLGVFGLGVIDLGVEGLIKLSEVFSMGVTVLGVVGLGVTGLGVVGRGVVGRREWSGEVELGMGIVREVFKGSEFIVVGSRFIILTMALA
jgi:hypothetical protein